MYNSLQDVSEQLDNVIEQLIVDTKKNLDEITGIIEALNVKLQNMEKTDLSAFPRNGLLYVFYSDEVFSAFVRGKSGTE